MNQHITRVFQSGNSQAIRLPREFRLDEGEVFIRKEGNTIVITPRPKTWDGFLQGCESLSEDFSTEGEALPSDTERDSL